MSFAPRIPVTVVTGFLGAGKTSLIRHLLETANGRRLALIVNEFGDVGVDGEVLKACGADACREEDIVELANGCICCTVADDFIPTMEGGRHSVQLYPHQTVIAYIRLGAISGRIQPMKGLFILAEGQVAQYPGRVRNPAGLGHLFKPAEDSVCVFRTPSLSIAKHHLTHERGIDVVAEELFSDLRVPPRLGVVA